MPRSKKEKKRNTCSCGKPKDAKGFSEVAVVLLWARIGLSTPRYVDYVLVEKKKGSTRSFFAANQRQLHGMTSARYQRLQEVGSFLLLRFKTNFKV